MGYGSFSVSVSLSPYGGINRSLARKKVVKLEDFNKERKENPPVKHKKTGKRKKHRKMRYDVRKMKVGDIFIYDGSLASGRVLASLKGKETGWKFKAIEGEKITIKRVN